MTILPEAEQLRKAIKWISDAHLEDPGIPLFKLIEEGSFKFNLSPKDEEFLMHFFIEKASEKSE
ncbi:MAG TPA: hypothetical protein VFG09_11780 [Thermodesulfovibrionales bacterium]|jgi:hypothetical protein|nr:hypothetical protein [Thermodesulfovibrionales bacterium]